MTLFLKETDKVDGVDGLVSAAGAHSWSLVDLGLAVGVGLSVIVGLWRGFVTEVLSLVGWAVAYFSAQWLGVGAATMVPVGEPGSRLNLLAGMIVVFVLAWLAWALLSWAVTQMVRAAGLSGVDRLLGGGFGFLRGVLVALVVITLVGMTPLAQSASWQASKGVVWLEVLLRGLGPVLPPQVVKFLPGQPEPRQP